MCPPSRGLVQRGVAVGAGHVVDAVGAGAEQDGHRLGVALGRGVVQRQPAVQVLRVGVAPARGGEEGQEEAGQVEGGSRAVD